MNILKQLKRERIRTAILFLIFCVILLTCQWFIKDGVQTGYRQVPMEEAIQ